jgi:hypothetical protein
VCGASSFYFAAAPNHHKVDLAATMALDSFFHNKIESMKLEIIQGQAVLRRLEAQRNDYNSRGITPAERDVAWKS